MSYQVSFSIPFHAEMSSPQVDWLRAELGLTFHGRPKPPACPPYAFGLLDPYSGLFLVEEDGEDWRLECRSYRAPSPEQIADWKARADWVVEALPRH
jgi:hypothetical protein